MVVTFPDPTHMTRGSEDESPNLGPTSEFEKDQWNHEVLFTGIMW